MTGLRQSPSILFRIFAPGAAMALRVGRLSIGAATEPAPRGCPSEPISILNFGGGLVGNVRGADGLLEHRDQRVLNVGRRIRGVRPITASSSAIFRR